MIAAQRILTWIVNALLVVSGICIILMMLVVVADAFMRGVFNSTLPGAEEYSSNYFMVAVTFLPLAFVQRMKGHVIIELFTSNLPPRGIAGLDAVVNLVCGVGAAIFGWAAYGKAVAMTRAGEYAIGTVFVTIWPTRWMLFFGILVLAATLFFQAIKDSRVAIGLDPPESDEQAGLVH